MSQSVIKVENLSKAYQIGQIGTGTISRDLERFWTTKILGKEDPFLKIGETNDRLIKGTSDIVWSLKDLNFEINQGDAVGIIGKNGAGKSTLLKLLSRVTSPTTGSIKVKGRIASLLEVGTGFHPELSGRENIYLNGAILGMRKKEISRKLDEIIDFSGVERYVDTPVKRYSSGMYVRLAFAVAAHLDSEILIVDEVLAVGDAEFQKKCLGKMSDISKGEGRTVLFVSHNMAAVKSLCNKGIMLENGLIKNSGTVDQVVNFYNDSFSEVETFKTWTLNAPGNETAKIKSIKVFANDSNNYIENDMFIEIIFENLQDNNFLNISVSIFDNNESYLISTPNLERNALKKGTYKSICKLEKNTFNTGKYFFTILLVGNNFEILAQLDKIVSIEFNELGTQRGNYFGDWNGALRPYFNWTNDLIENYVK
jgi:lipopolysaccharide transport system ATP-binding protein